MSALLTPDELREGVANCGGLVSASDLARRWHLSRTRVFELTNMDGFPGPVDWPSGRPVWLWVEVNDWRERRRNGGKP